MNDHKQVIYDSLESAEADGWITVGDARRQLAGTSYRVTDTSGSNPDGTDSQGYAFSIGRRYDKKLDGEITQENMMGVEFIASDTISLEHFDKRSNRNCYKFKEMFSQRLLTKLLNNKGE